MASPWKRLRYRLEWIAVKALAIGMPLLPRPLLMATARGLGSIAFYADKRGRTTAIENLRVVFGDRYTDRERRQVARRAFQNFARTVLDQFWTPRVTRISYLKYCDIQMDDEAQIEATRETGAIWVTPHYGNFEWTVLVMGLRDYDFTIVAQDFKNSLLTDIFKANREATGHTVIPQRGAMLRLLKNLKAGGHAAFLTDLTIKPSRSATVIRCFGRKTCVTALPVAPLCPSSRVFAHPALTEPINCADSKRSNLPKMPATKKSLRLAGTFSNRTSARTRNPGCGCTNTGDSSRTTTQELNTPTTPRHRKHLKKSADATLPQAEAD